MVVMLFEYSDIVSKFVDPQVWFPVTAAMVGYFVQAWIKLIARRKEESRKAVIYLTEIEEEVKIGLNLFEFMYFHGGQPKMFGDNPARMTTEAWGPDCYKSVIPDDAFQRIINVAYRTKNDDVKQLRSHLKNYYVCICGQYQKIVDGSNRFDPCLYRNSLEGVRMVKNIVTNCKKMMELNSQRIFWPW